MAATAEQKRAYYLRNREKVIQRSADWRKADPKRYAAQRRSINAKRKAAKAQRTPSWANEAEIKMIYKQAASLQKLLGKPVDVDHVIPLRGELVSGLHVENNLQLMFAEDNQKKSNSYTPS
jgi:hypothetical protein